VTCCERRRRIAAEKLIIYPELIYRRYEDGVLQDETVLEIAMRCYYPAEFEQIIVDHGFRIVNRWGGYRGQIYGQGPELVVQFARGD
jgi:hypothetical protein